MKRDIGDPIHGDAVPARRLTGLTVPSDTCTPDPAWATLVGAGAVLPLTNEARTQEGLAPLVGHPALERSAQWKAMHMAGYSYMAHDDPAPPSLRSAGARIAACGYTAGWGENIAYGYPTPAAVVAGWMGSAGHRANILRPTFVAVGIAAAAKGNGPVYWAQCFGTSAAGAEPAPAPALSPNERMSVLRQQLADSDLFRQWRRDNPREHEAIEMLWDQGILPPTKRTAVGRAIEQAARTYRETL